jgi:hypothetical protein
VPLKLVSKEGEGVFDYNSWRFSTQSGKPIAYEFFLNSKRELIFDIATLKEDGSLEKTASYDLPLGAVKLGNYPQPDVIFNPYNEYFYVYGLGIAPRTSETTGAYLMQYKLGEVSPVGLSVFSHKDINALISGNDITGWEPGYISTQRVIDQKNENMYDIKSEHVVLTLNDDSYSYELKINNQGKIDRVDKYDKSACSSHDYNLGGRSPLKEYITVYNNNGPKERPLVRLMKKNITKESRSDMQWFSYQRDGYDLVLQLKGSKIDITAYQVKD